MLLHKCLTCETSPSHDSFKTDNFVLTSPYCSEIFYILLQNRLTFVSFLSFGVMSRLYSEQGHVFSNTHLYSVHSEQHSVINCYKNTSS
jgi:hypothetical protein